MKKEAKISKSRLVYIQDKIDTFLHSCLRPNEVIKMHITLRDMMHNQEEIGPVYMITSRFGR